SVWCMVFLWVPPNSRCIVDDPSAPACDSVCGVLESPEFDSTLVLKLHLQASEVRRNRRVVPG
ncbi:uncharacterized, partial [Tachysurus ichikawai]